MVRERQCIYIVFGNIDEGLARRVQPFSLNFDWGTSIASSGLSGGRSLIARITRWVTREASLDVACDAINHR